MDFFQILILSMVEGVTEFLPISSTGHLILVSHILGVSNSKILGTFEIAIQIGPILAVIFLYYQKLLQQKNLIYKAFIGFLPTGVLGLSLYPLIKQLLQSEVITILSLFTGGIAILIIEWYFKNSKSKTKNIENLTYKDCIKIGLFQSLAMIPGVSRSASSIFGGMALRLDRKSAVEFSFFLAIPTMAFATGYDVVKNISNFSASDILVILTGIVISFLVAIAVIKWLLNYVQTNNFFWFAVYRIVFSILYAVVYIY